MMGCRDCCFCSCPGVPCLERKLDTNFCMVGVSSCVLLFVVEWAAAVVVVFLLCVIHDARVVVPHCGSPGCTRRLSSR